MFRLPAAQTRRALNNPSSLIYCRCVPRRSIASPVTGKDKSRATEEVNLDRLARRRQDYDTNRRAFLVAGVVAGVISITYTSYKIVQKIQENPTKLDSGLAPTDPLIAAGEAKRKLVIHDNDGREIVPTGNSTVPHFPRTIELPLQSSASAVPTVLTEFTLVGLGLRSVSFLGIQVYVVGYYIATSDIAAIQSRLVKRVNPIATTLVAGERDELRRALLDPAESDKLWDELLRDGLPARSAFRVVPVRDTDFHHLRDGFVRAVQARSAQVGVASGPADDDGFGEAMKEFRALFNRGRVPKKKELLLVRDKGGLMTVAYDDGSAEEPQLLGSVADERVSRAIWLNYLAGSKVASEPARKSIVEGVMEFVERPVGTVAAQVV
jgi:hypothetical protein